MLAGEATHPLLLKREKNTSNHAGADPESGSLGWVEDPKSRVVVQLDRLTIMLKSVKSKLSGVGRKKSEGGAPETKTGRPAGPGQVSGSRPPASGARPGSKENPSSSSGNIPPMEVLYDKNKPLFLFRDVVASERQNLFIKKLQLCSYTFDLTDILLMSGRRRSNGRFC